MISRRLLLLGILAGALLPESAESQISFSNMLETRVGKDPDDPIANVPTNRMTLFDQFNFDWFQNELRVGFRYETYKPSDDKTLEYSRFSRRYVEWAGSEIEARVGNFEALFARGVVLRAFELPGVIREEFGTPQFGDSRDLDGVKFEYHGERLELVALGGNPRFPNDPPTQDRRGLISGGTATLQVVRGVRVGGEYLRIDSQSSDIITQPPRTAEVPGGFVQLSMDRWLRKVGLKKLSLDTFVEMAQASGLNLPKAGSSPKLEPDKGRGYYFSQNVFLDEVIPKLRWGMSWEYKDYQNFELRVNEPPTLVREHKYALLNRTTHVAELIQEEGYQFESIMNLYNYSTLTLNWSRAENRDNKEFREFYAELQGDYRDVRLSLFTGDSDDPIASLIDRQTYGVYGITPLPWTTSLELEYEQMTAVRVSGNDNLAFKDNYLALTWAHAGGLAITGIHQTTDDPVDATDRVTGQISRRAYTSLVASINIGNHALTGFWGRRRGGLQCTAGTCYLVRAFDGVLFQFISRF